MKVFFFRKVPILETRNVLILFNLFQNLTSLGYHLAALPVDVR